VDVFYFKGTPSWIMQKTFFRHFSLDYLQCGRELMMRCKLFVKCCALFTANSTGAKQCAAHHRKTLRLFSANWYNFTRQGKYSEEQNIIFL
jgi:hypothetical protein